jgi:hypothetical protein
MEWQNASIQQHDVRLCRCILKRHTHPVGRRQVGTRVQLLRCFKADQVKNYVHLFGESIGPATQALTHMGFAADWDRLNLNDSLCEVVKGYVV